jgi:hypothetical protein
MVKVGGQRKIQLPPGLQGMPGMEQLAQQLEQLSSMPGMEDLEGLVGGNFDALGGGTASQFFQNLAQTASARAGQRTGQSLLGNDQNFSTQALVDQTSNTGNFNALASNSLARPSRIGDSSGIDRQLMELGEIGGGGGYFEDRIFAIMCKVVEDMQKKIEERLTKLQKDAEAAEAEAKSGGGGGGGGGGGEGQESRNIEFEKIKFDMQKLSQMQQAMSNVLNTMDELAKSAIRNIKGG